MPTRANALHNDDATREGRRARALEIHQRLCAAYRCPIAYFHELDPLSEMISSMLSHRTRNADSGRAFKSLRAAFPRWEDVRDAPVDAIERSIGAVTWPEQKAPRIKKALELVSEWTAGALDLDFLAGLSEADARAWLERIPGLGPKTSAAVLSFSTLRGASLPVDSHHHRVAARLGLIDQNVAVGPSHSVLRGQLPSDFDARALYDNHQVMMRHGQRRCFHTKPDCASCEIFDLCPTGRGLLGCALESVTSYALNPMRSPAAPNS